MYKYMPLRKEFFENFLVRATQRCALNDPFEVLPSRAWLEGAYHDHYGSHHRGSFESLLRDVTKLNLNDMGIISLTNRPDNILMWSHYADDHKGMVVEFDENNRELKSRFRKSSNHPLTQSVIYRRDRLKTCYTNNRFLPYLYKSIEWAYEEEQRVIVNNMYDCDCWIYFFEKVEEAKSAFGSKEIAGIQLNDCKLNKKAISFKTADICQPFNQHLIVSNPKFMGMFRIPVAAIKSVTFGVNADGSEVQKICHTIECTPALKHIEKRRAKLEEHVFGIDHCI